jgi:hypothetical protein
MIFWSAFTKHPGPNIDESFLEGRSRLARGIDRSSTARIILLN